MLSIKFKKEQGAIAVRLSEEKISYFTGSELVVGIGPKKDLTTRKWRLIARQVISMAKQYKLKEISVNAKDFDLDGVELAINFEMANYQFSKYKSIKDDIVETIYLQHANQKEVERGQIIGEEVNNTRSLANTPGGDMTPLIFAERAKEAAKGTKVQVKVLDKDDMKSLKMGGVLGVAQGSSEEPKFVILEYYGSKKSDAPIVLVGKGITFDSGGLNVKPGDYMTDMHLDMSGGAAVVHSIVAAAKLGIKKNIVGLIPTVENMPSGSSYRPGDVLRTMSGQTIEVGNTDAEGRVVLSDALTYAEKYKPMLVVDVATLTGAAEVALGQRASAIFSKDKDLLQKFQELGEASGDYVWPLPLWDEYEDEIKGNFGDWSNIGKTKWGGAITGAIFLYQWAKNYPWVHIDMAPRMLAVEGEYLAKGAAGAPVRLLVKVLEMV
ncbi:MAG: leucyl aminopeptidase [Patescibacteria group bacterium]